MVFFPICGWSLLLINLVSVDSFSSLPRSVRSSRRFSSVDGGEDGAPPAERTTVPTRRDTCRLLVSGVVGSPPKETYLAVGNNFVLNFPLAVTGHFSAIHDWERYKPTETMWLSCEVWNDMARAHQENLYKGASVSGVATMIFNKWIDKTTGEERKMTKVRFTHLMSSEELADMVGSSGIEDMIGPAYEDDPSGSGFASESPAMSDQAMPPAPRVQPMKRPAMAAPQPQRTAPAPPPAFRGELDVSNSNSNRPAPASRSRGGGDPTIPF